MTQQNTIKVNDKDYDIDTFPDNIKQLVVKYSEWEQKFVQAQNEIANIQKELKDKEDSLQLLAIGKDYVKNGIITYVSELDKQPEVETVDTIIPEDVPHAEQDA